jgi:hypothetical protein
LNTSALHLNVYKTSLSRMMTRVSRARMRLRLQLGVSRKLTVTRWIGSTTVRVGLSCVSKRQVSYAKASEGVEKSCRGTRRTRRGLRSGKRRARRQTSLQVKTTAPKEKKSVHDSVHRERLFERMRGSQEKLFLLVRRLNGDFSYPLSDLGWRSLRNQWARTAHRYPPQFRMMFFASSFRQLYVTLEHSVSERPPPLPSRKKNAYVPDWYVSDVPAVHPNVVHREKDPYGPEPCAWCRDEGWEDDSQWSLGCLRIQRCVRNPRLAIKRAPQTRSPDVKGPRHTGSRGRPRKR